MSHHSPKYVAIKTEHMIHLLQVADAVAAEMEHPALREAIAKTKKHLI